MRFLSFQIRNTVESPTLDDFAYAVCWINSDDGHDSRFRAEKMIADQGWQIEEMLENKPITKSDNRSEYIRYYEQAELDDEVLVIFCVRK